MLAEKADTELISIHALREEGDQTNTTKHQRCLYFYPRPPRGGRLHGSSSASPMNRLFLSTPSARRATVKDLASILQKDISIHALREEGDDCQRAAHDAEQQISIHALREEGDNAI